MLYNVPGRTGVDLQADTVIKLFNDVENIYGVKEATGSLERCVELLSKSKDLVVVSGDDAINYPMLANGGKGVISVTANLIPNKIAELVSKALTGDFLGSKAINDEIYELNKNLFIESNPIPIKAIMYLAGLIDTLEYRLPLTEPSSETMKRLESVLATIEVLK
jgi:4-hydroxy-tetrahydrodipicolinate synthase